MSSWLRDLTLRVLVVAALTASPMATPTFADDDGILAYRRGDYARAAPILLRRAEAGEARAQAYVGEMYSEGLGLPRDLAEAARWLRRASEQGEPGAQYLLGLAYDKGRGVKQDFVEAEVWLDLAVANADAKTRDHIAAIRDAVANKLSLDELALSQKRAAEFRPVLNP